MLFSLSSDYLFFNLKNVDFCQFVFAYSPHYSRVITVHCKNEQLKSEMFSQFTKMKSS